MCLPEDQAEVLPFHSVDRFNDLLFISPETTCRGLSYSSLFSKGTFSPGRTNALDSPPKVLSVDALLLSPSLFSFFPSHLLFLLLSGENEEEMERTEENTRVRDTSSFNTCFGRSPL